MSSKRTAGRAAKRPEVKETRKSYLPFIIIGGVLAVAVGVGVVLFRPKTADNRPTGLSSAPGTSSSPAAATNTPAPRAPSSPSPGAAPPRVRGDMSAPVTLEEFGDFECPPCAALHPELKKIEAEFGPK
ncbi:MAG TPA: thioredoxin domain-containing protein, partial [Pyrinomonadaceae bacterium]|nr:thioredoxin domain-containing protein [Pyrinomonadaceae bacterium]